MIAQEGKEQIKGEMEEDPETEKEIPSTNDS